MFCPTMGNDAYPHLALQPTRNGLVSRYVTADSKNSLYLDMGSVKTIDRSYITDLSDRAMKDVVDENYDSAITKSRTLLEEVFCYVTERKGEEPSESGDIGKLYN